MPDPVSAQKMKKAQISTTGSVCFRREEIRAGSFHIPAPERFSFFILAIRENALRSPMQKEH
jgi:hypothetical protein